jgi:predicted nucleic acid-binding Zn ribbon protein
VSEERLSDLIDPALRGLGVRGQVREERLRLALADVVGAGLAALCRAERLDRGVLLIATTNSALAHQLQMDAPRVIDALNRRVGQDLVRRIRFTAM